MKKDTLLGFIVVVVVVVVVFAVFVVADGIPAVNSIASLIDVMQ